MTDHGPSSQGAVRCPRTIRTRGIVASLLRGSLTSRPLRSLLLVPPAASVVICSRDRHSELARTLAVLPALRSDAGQHEIIIVDDGSASPFDPDLAAGAKLLRTPGLGLASARNVGLIAATGEIVCFTDDDCEPDPDW